MLQLADAPAGVGVPCVLREEEHDDQLVIMQQMDLAKVTGGVQGLGGEGQLGAAVAPLISAVAGEKISKTLTRPPSICQN